MLKNEKAKFQLIIDIFSCNVLFLTSFHKLKWSTYIVELQADDDFVVVSVPENVTRDVAGNKNLASNVLQVRHCKIPFYIFLLVIVLQAIISKFLFSFVRCKIFLEKILFI